MNAAEIREFQERRLKHYYDGKLLDVSVRDFWLSEIAAQLAESNERAARVETEGKKVVERSLALMERSEKGLDELDGKRKASHGSSQS